MKQFIKMYIMAMIVLLSITASSQRLGGDTTNVPTGPASSTCAVIIDSLHLDYTSSNIGDTIIIEAHNTDKVNIFSYPGFKIYIVNSNGDNILFGKEVVNYYGIGETQQFKISSNTTKFQPDEEINLSLELWSGFYDIWECTFNWNGRVNFDPPVPSTCDVVIDNVFLGDTSSNIGDTVIIGAHNTDTVNIFSYPGFRVYIVDGNGNNMLFGEETVNSYGIGDYQEFTVKSNKTTIQRDQAMILSLELWSGFYDILECVFSWNGRINLKEATLAPIATTKDARSASTASANSVSATSVSATESNMVQCNFNDGSTSCGQNTCQCPGATQCDTITNQCKTFTLPSTATRIYKLQSFILLFVILFGIM